MTLATLSIQAVIGSTDYSAYVISSEREAVLETPGATATLIMNASFPHASISPWDVLVVHEQGVLVFTGFVTHIIPGRMPAQTLIQGMDTYKRCRDWFLPDTLYTGGPLARLSTDLTTRNVGYYVGYLCDLCGIAYSINDSVGSSVNLIADIPLGMRSVSEALITLAAVGSWNLRVDPAGVLQFDHIPHPSAADYHLGEPISFEQDFNDTDTRNECKVWGYSLDSGSTNNGGAILYKESRSVTGVPDTRTMVFADPHIDTVGKASDLAAAALDQWARLEKLVSAQVVGNANLRVGQAVDFTDSRLASGLFMDTLTDIRASDGPGGYQQLLTAGRRAYRYPYWPLSQPPAIEWEATSVLGEALDCTIFGGSIYSVGYTYLGNHQPGREIWRVERRLLTDGSLVWARNIDHMLTHNSIASNPSTNMWAVGITVTLDGVFVVGSADTDGYTDVPSQFVDCLSSASGITLWSDGPRANYGKGQDVAATSSGIIVLGEGPLESHTYLPPLNIHYTLQRGPTLYPYAPATGVRGTGFTPTSTEHFDGRVFTPDLYLLRRLYADSDGGLLTCGYYQYPYFKQVYPGFPPPDPYLYRRSAWFGKLSLAGTVWESKGSDNIGISVNYGTWLDTASDLNLSRQYVIGTDSLAGANVGGLAKFNTTSQQWRVNTGEVDPYCHMEIGRYVYMANGVALQWYDTNSGSFVSSRTAAGITGLHGVQIYVPTTQVVVCGIKNGLFWTALWNQPV